MNANVAIVTGGAGRMGSAVVRRLARDGVTVAILDAYAEQAQAVAAGVMAGGGQAEAVVVDLADLGSVTEAVAALVDRYGRVDMLCNAAGGVGPRMTAKGAAASWAGQMFWESDPASWAAHVQHNLNTCMNMCYAVLPHMIESRHGRILNWVTGTVQTGRRGIAPYAAAKGAVLAFTKALAKEAGPYGITVNDISFGELLGQLSNAGRPRARTAYLHVDYRKITPIGVPLQLHGAFVSEEGRKRVLAATAHADGGLVAEARGLFVELRPGQP
jgi:3-oxoacyl-[acyl-carrier protein] reductase